MLMEGVVVDSELDSCVHYFVVMGMVGGPHPCCIVLILSIHPIHLSE